jgi:hypothetical protein
MPHPQIVFYIADEDSGRKDVPYENIMVEVEVEGEFKDGKPHDLC